MREHILKNLPKMAREALTKKKVDRTQQTNWVSIHVPPLASPAGFLDLVGKEIGLRIRDFDPHSEALVVDCLTEVLVEKLSRWTA